MIPLHSDDDYGTPEELARWLASCEDPSDEDLAAWAAEAPQDGAQEAPAAITGGAPPAGPAPGDPWRSRGIGDIFDGPMGETRMLCAALDLGPGRPFGVWGGPGSGKTTSIQALALAIATGRPIWDLLPCNKGRILHMSWDVGFRAIKLRYRQLANGMGITRRELTDQLVVCPHPSMTLSKQGAEKAFAKRVEGFDLAIIDNLRDASPGLKENDSDFGERVTMFGRVCEAAGCTPLYLHHTRKDENGGIDSARGSSAIPAATGAVWRWSGTGKEPRKVTQLRQHDMSDTIHDPLWLIREEAPGGPYDMGDEEPGKPRRAFRFRATYDQPKDPAAAAGKAVIAALKKESGVSKTRLYTLAGIKKESVDVAVKNLLEKGLIIDDGSGDQHVFRLPESRGRVGEGKTLVGGGS